MMHVEITPLNLFAMAKRAFRGRFTNPLAQLAMVALESLDSVVLTVLPFLKRYCGELVVVARK